MRDEELPVADATAATPYEVRSERRFWVSRGLGAALFAGVCAIALRAGGVVAFVTGVVGLVLFGAFGAYALRQSLRTGPRLTLDATGIDAADLGVGRIGWEAIEHVAWFGSPEAPFLALHVRDPASWVARMPPWARGVQRLLRAQGLPAFAVNLIGVDRDSREVAARARAWLERGAPR
jgi:hypothetical protein